jgi:tetratricopeptide (TPR) repeat protein
LGSLHNLGAVYSLRGQFDLALAAYDEAYRLACELNSPKQAVTLLATTYVYWQTCQYQPAHHTLDKFAQIASTASLFQGYFYYGSAVLALDEGDLETACNWFVRSRSIAEQIGDPALNIFIRMGQSQYLRTIGDAPAALFSRAGAGRKRGGCG